MVGLVAGGNFFQACLTGAEESVECFRSQGLALGQPTWLCWEIFGNSAAKLDLALFWPARGRNSMFWLRLERRPIRAQAGTNLLMRLSIRVPFLGCGKPTYK